MNCNCLNKDLVEKEIYQELINQINGYGNNQSFCIALLGLLDRIGFDVDKKLIEHVCNGDYENALVLIKEKL